MRFLPPTPTPRDPDRVRAAWHRFVTTGEVEHDSVRPHTGRAWQRSAAAGCDPYQARANLLTADETAALLSREARLIQVATPFLLALSDAAGDERHAAMLSDGAGRVLKIVGDAATMADEYFPRAGSLLSEATAGANGIGTTLAEGHYVELVGPEHYIEGFHVFTCQGVPLLGTAEAPAGVLSMSVRRVEVATRVRDILFCASEAAECELLSGTLQEALTMTAGMAVVLEKLRQDIVQRLAMARLQLELGARQIAAGVDASATIKAAQDMARSFQRQAAVWRGLVAAADDGVETIALGDLVDDFINLLQTEARVSYVKLAYSRGENARVLDGMRSLCRRLLSAFLNVMQQVDRHTTIDVEVGVDQQANLAVVSIRGTSPLGDEVIDRVDAPVATSRSR